MVAGLHGRCWFPFQQNYLLESASIPPMSAMAEFREEIEHKPPFLLPLAFALGLGALGGILMIWLRLAHGINIGFLLIGIGALCGLGTRLGGGDFSSTLLALAMVQFVVVLFVGTVEVARDLEASWLSLLLEVFMQGKFTGFLNQCVSAFFVSSASVRPLIFAYPVAWGVSRIGRD